MLCRSFRLQSRVLQRINIHCQRFLSNVNCEYHLKDEEPKVCEKIEIPSEFENIQTKSVKTQYEFSIDENGFACVYTDGSCTHNGSKDAKAGIGVWFGDNHPLNVSQPIVGRSTCNVAEIMAATEAIRQAKKAGIKKLKLHTDSLFVIQCITNWMSKWKLTGWKTSNKKPVINKEELLELENALSSIEVDWVHVSSHSGVHGNEMANLLAKSGINNTQ